MVKSPNDWSRLLLRSRRMYFKPIVCWMHKCFCQSHHVEACRIQSKKICHAPITNPSCWNMGWDQLVHSKITLNITVHFPHVAMYTAAKNSLVEGMQRVSRQQWIPKSHYFLERKIVKRNICLSIFAWFKRRPTSYLLNWNELQVSRPVLLLFHRLLLDCLDICTARK